MNKGKNSNPLADLINDMENEKKSQVLNPLN